jgi:chromosome partitioning protein
MQIITVINAKGGCGKSTIAMSVASGLAEQGHETILFDMDPQAQVTQWLGLGDGLSPEGTIVDAMEGKRTLEDLVQPTKFKYLSFVASAQGLEDIGRQITDRENYATLFTGLLATLHRPLEFVVIDSPNQISPIMENVIYPSDLFIVPFESTKAVRSYANFFQLLMRLRPDEEHRVLHVLANLSRQRGLRQRVIDALALQGIPRARSEVRTCGWLAQVDENGGNIFQYRPHSIGAEDMRSLVAEVLELLGHQPLSDERDLRDESPIQPQPSSSITLTVQGNTADVRPAESVGGVPNVAADNGGLSNNQSQPHEAA